MQRQLRIILVDDEIYFGEILSELLERQGHVVGYFVRARVQEDKLWLMDITGAETVIEEGVFDLALVDGRLKGSSLDGWQLTPHLVRRRLPVLAMSGADSINAQMLASGATEAVRKDLLWDHLRTKSLDALAGL